MSLMYTHIRESDVTGAISDYHNDPALSSHACIEICMPLYLWSIICLARPAAIQMSRGAEVVHA